MPYINTADSLQQAQDISVLRDLAGTTKNNVTVIRHQVLSRRKVYLLFKINTTSTPSQNKLALHICHDSQWHLIEHSLDTVPPCRRALEKQRANQ